MKLRDLIPKKAILLDIDAKDKDDAIKTMVKKMGTVYKQADFDASAIVRAIKKRESIGSTGIGSGVAVPHAKSDIVRKVRCIFGRVNQGIDFNSVDGEPVTLVFLLVSPTDKAEDHVEALKLISTAIRQPNVVRFLNDAETVPDVEVVFGEVDEAVTA
jgi:PTS system fructose-specific IIC component